MNNLPNKITITRIALIPFIIFFYLTNLFTASKIVALTLFVFALFTDFLDGYIARKYNLVTNFGKFLDPIADKLIAVTGVLLILTSNVINVKFGIIVAFTMVARDTIVDFLRIVASQKNVVISADFWGKLKTVALSIFVPVFMLIDVNNSMLFMHDILVNILYSIGYLFTVAYIILCVFSCFNYLRKNKNLLG